MAEAPGTEQGARAGGEDSVRRAWLLSGRVQGVGFRWWTARSARALGLRGTVQNLADGRVELHVAGPADAVRTLARRLHEGPPAARVRELEQIEAADSLPPDFQITG